MSSLKNGKFFALFVFSSVLFFALFFMWSIDHRGRLDTFSIQKSVICVNVDEKLSPRDVGEIFHFGVRQLCLWLQHDGACRGDKLRFLWYFKDQLVQQRSCVLSGKENYNLFYLMKSDGSSLPVGDYQVEVKLNNRFVSKAEFKVVNERVTP